MENRSSAGWNWKFLLITKSQLRHRCLYLIWYTFHIHQNNKTELSFWENFNWAFSCSAVLTWTWAQFIELLRLHWRNMCWGEQSNCFITELTNFNWISPHAITTVFCIVGGDGGAAGWKQERKRREKTFSLLNEVFSWLHTICYRIDTAMLWSLQRKHDKLSKGCGYTAKNDERISQKFILNHRAL